MSIFKIIIRFVLIAAYSSLAAQIEVIDVPVITDDADIPELAEDDLEVPVFSDYIDVEIPETSEIDNDFEDIEIDEIPDGLEIEDILQVSEIDGIPDASNVDEVLELGDDMDLSRVTDYVEVDETTELDEATGLEDDFGFSEVEDNVELTESVDGDLPDAIEVIEIPDITGVLELPDVNEPSEEEDISFSINGQIDLTYYEIVKVPGITEPLQDADISASINGKIDSIFYREGQFVEKDTVVIQLNDELEKLESDRRKVIYEDKAELEASIAEMETVKIDMESTQELFDRTKSISKEELNKKILDYKIAQAKMNKTINEELREGLEFQMAEFKLQQRSIKAPFSGIVDDVLFEEGEDCSANDTLFRLVDISKCHFTCNIENDLAVHLKKNQSVELEIISGLDLVQKEGIVEFIAPTIDPASGLRKVKVLVDNTDLKLTPGATGTLNIKVETLK